MRTPSGNSMMPLQRKPSAPISLGRFVSMTGGMRFWNTSAGSTQPRPVSALTTAPMPCICISKRKSAARMGSKLTRQPSAAFWLWWIICSHSHRSCIPFSSPSWMLRWTGKMESPLPCSAMTVVAEPSFCIGCGMTLMAGLPLQRFCSMSWGISCTFA